MPIYEYLCRDCQIEFEELQSFDAPPPACPECGSAAVERLLSLAAFHLKGSGWYAKDSKSSSGQNAGVKKDEKQTTEKTETSDKKTSAASTESSAKKDGGEKKKTSSGKKDGKKAS